MYLVKNEQESIKALICGESFMPKLLETVTKSEIGLTEDGATLLLASLKFGETFFSFRIIFCPKINDN